MGASSPRYVFGPVPSRRLGRSLGVDPVPLKTCTWSCVYCQLGRTPGLCTEIAEHVPTRSVIDQLRERLSGAGREVCDWITFVGSGEPTLHSGLGAMVEAAVALDAAPVAVITNGSLLHRREVRRRLLPAHAVMPTLSAGSEALYRELHRPHPELTLARLVEGIAALRSEYAGQLWLEVMLVAGLNDTPRALAELAETIARTGADEVHVNLPTRAAAEPWVSVPGPESVMRAKALLGEVATVRAAQTSLALRGPRDQLAAELAELVSRHPTAEDELVEAIETSAPGSSREVLRELAETDGARAIERHGRRFWVPTESDFFDAPETVDKGPQSLR